MMRLVRGSLAVALVLIISGPGGGLRAEHDAPTPAQERIEETIHQYLLSHPDVMIEVSDILRARQKASQAEQTRLNIAALRAQLLNDPTSPVAGDPDGDVTLVEFFDYHCTYCKRVLDDVNAVLDEDPGLRIVYKEFPILGPDSVVAARAALAAYGQDPDKYRAYHTALMSSRSRLTRARVLQIAGEVGYDIERLKDDMDAPAIDQIIQRNVALAEALGINGTPGFVIGDQLIPGVIDIDTMRRLIAEARQS